MSESIFETSLKERAKDQEQKMQSCELDMEDVVERVNISMPSSCRKKLNDYCKKHYISQSALIRSWIDEYCNE